MALKWGAVILLTGIAFAGIPALAWETDQYALPPAPLMDVGGLAADFVFTRVDEALSELNRRISEDEACLASRFAGWPRHCRLSAVTLVPRLDEERSRRALERELASLRSPRSLAREVHARVGSHFPSSQIERFLEGQQQRARWMPPFSASAFSRYLLVDWLSSPTIQAFGVRMGTDKLGHLFQQGYSYFVRVDDSVASGATPAAAESETVRWGQGLEHGVYGTFMSGVFSNADLAANFAGLRFYQWLASPVRIRGEIRPPYAELKDGLWRRRPSDPALSASRRLSLLVSDHLNEALNPSLFDPLLRRDVEKLLRSLHCRRWSDEGRLGGSGPDATGALELSSWFGEDYGHVPDPAGALDPRRFCRSGSEK
jgi:hypothetical protein